MRGCVKAVPKKCQVFLTGVLAFVYAGFRVNVAQDVADKWKFWFLGVLRSNDEVWNCFYE